jgi:hypothetical protein
MRLAVNVVAGIAAAAVLAPAALAGDKVLEFESMAGVVRPFTGSANAVRGVNGGGLPWVIRVGKGEVKADGRVEVKVRGHVLADDPAVPPARRLVNPIPNFRAVVSCLTVDAASLAATVNVTMGDFPATTGGDSEIEAALQFPSPCLAPIVFVTSPGGAWFAVTGG